MKEAILEVNHWCHEKVTYRPSDSRTTSPLATVSAAFGRCGEESTFTVAALRAIGIPARQVYTPRWAHTDDNHAWVEAWADGKWHFLGACEPEPVLDLGWFNAPASRGMLMHTRVFGKYNGTEEVMLRTANYTEINVIDNYAETARATVAVQDEQGRPVAGATVEFKLYNYAEFYTVATKYTDTAGETSLTAGRGDMLVWASKGDMYGFSKLSFGKEDTLTIRLNHRPEDTEVVNMDIVPPVEKAKMPTVTPEQRAENDRRLAQEDSIRHAYENTFLNAAQAFAFCHPLNIKEAGFPDLLVASWGNHHILTSFLKSYIRTEHKENAIELISYLSQKDLRDVAPQVLEDHLLYTPAYDSTMGISTYNEYVLNPRVTNEMLVPYKEFFTKHLPENNFRAEPKTLIRWVNETISINDSINTMRTLISPVGVFRMKVSDRPSRDLFFVAVARSVGLPARIDEVTGKVQYVEERRWMDVNFDGETSVSTPETGRLLLEYDPTKILRDPAYYTHFTLSKYEGGTYHVLNYPEETTWSKFEEQGVLLDAGDYLLTTGTRLASGAVLSHLHFFTVKPRTDVTVPLVIRSDDTQVQVIGNFNFELLFTPTDLTKASVQKQSFLQACGRGYFVVGILGVGQEPTNHALRDIAALASEFEAWGRKMVLLFPTEEQMKRFQMTEFSGLPSHIIYGIDTENVHKQIVAENVHLTDGTLPLFIIADTFNRVVFVLQGYTIGLGEQMMKVIHGL